MTSFLLRVDDFPRLPMSCEGFMKFHEIMESRQIPYLLGATPKICLEPLNSECKEYRNFTDEEVNILKNIRKNAEFAYHGTTHQVLSSLAKSEFIGLDEKTAFKKIKTGIDILKKNKINPKIIIPPFNTFDLSNLQVFKKFFDICTGGPETAKIFGKIPAGNLDGIYYMPTYEPLYGHVENIINGVKNFTGDFGCITIHWAWDMKNNFKNTIKLADLIEGKAGKWNINMLRTNL